MIDSRIRKAMAPTTSQKLSGYPLARLVSSEDLTLLVRSDSSTERRAAETFRVRPFLGKL